MGELRDSIVGILAKSSGYKYAGTGFFVMGGLILTCAHVVKEARSLNGKILFCLDGQDKWHFAELIFNSDSDEHDIAILKPVDFTEYIIPLPLVMSRQSGGHAFKSFGYPIEGAGRGLHGDGKIDGWVIDTLGRDGLQISSTKITHGFSGCPVWDNELSGVVGMVSSGFDFGLDKKLGEVAFAIPSEVVNETFPELILHSVKVPVSNGFSAMHQLPPLPDDFEGREKEIANIFSVIESGTRSLCIHGMGGIGKTTIALKIAHLLTSRYPDGQIFIDMRGMDEKIVSPADAIVRVITSLHSQINIPKDEQGLRSLYLSLLHGKRVLFLFDNVRDKSQVELLIPPKNCFLLVTSRYRFILPGQEIVDIEQMDPNDSVRLIARIAHRLRNDPSLSEGTNNILKIAELCSYIPLAIRIVASTLAEHVDLSTDEVIKKLRDNENRLKLTGIEASLQLSYSLLKPKQQELWEMLGVFPGDFDISAATSLWNTKVKIRRIDPFENFPMFILRQLVNVPIAVLQLLLKKNKAVSEKPSGRANKNEIQNSTKDQLSNLVQYSLLDYNSKTNRYKLHDLSRLFAVSLISKKNLSKIQKRLTIYYMNLLYESEHRSDMSVATRYNLFAQEKGNITTAQAWARNHFEKDRELAKICRDLPYMIPSFSGTYLYIDEKIYWFESALFAFRYLNEVDIETKIRTFVMRFFGIDEIVNSILVLGIFSRMKGELDKSLEYINEALEITRSNDKYKLRHNIFLELGVTYLDLGDLQKAIEYEKKCIEISRKIGDHVVLGGSLVNLGLATIRLGNIVQAIEFYTEALFYLQMSSDRNFEFEGNAMSNLGDAYVEIDDNLKAIEYFEKALKLYELYQEGLTSDSYGHQIKTLIGLSRTYANLDRISVGKEYFIRASSILEHYISDISTRGDFLNSLGDVCLDLKEPNQAIELFEQALQIYRSIENRKGESFVLNNLGEAFAQRGEIAQALQFYEQSLLIKRSLKTISWMEAFTLYNVALAFNQIGDREKANINANLASTLVKSLSVSDQWEVRKKKKEWEKIGL